MACMRNLWVPEFADGEDVVEQWGTPLPLSVSRERPQVVGHFGSGIRHVGTKRGPGFFDCLGKRRKCVPERQVKGSNESWGWFPVTLREHCNTFGIGLATWGMHQLFRPKCPLLSSRFRKKSKMRQGVLEQVSSSGFHSAILSLILGVSFFFRLPICWLVLKEHPENLFWTSLAGPFVPIHKKLSSRLPRAIARARSRQGFPSCSARCPWCPPSFCGCKPTRRPTPSWPKACAFGSNRSREPSEGWDTLPSPSPSSPVPPFARELYWKRFHKKES